MAPSPTTARSTNENDDNNCTAASKSYFQKTVCLKDWWLVKAENDFEGKRLGVAGFTSREKQAIRVFSSAPILRRYDLFTLDTSDGICVIIEGFINKARAEENGFPYEVSEHFISGFPPYWEIYSGNCSGGESPLMDVAQSNLDIKKLSHKLEGVKMGPSETTPANTKKGCNEEGRKEGRNKRKLGANASSKGGKRENKGNLKSQEVESAFDSNVSHICPRVRREVSFGESLVRSRRTLESSGNSHDENLEQPLAPAGLAKNPACPSTEDDENVSQYKKFGGIKCILKSFKDYRSNSPLSACRLNETGASNSKPQALEDPRKLETSKDLLTMMASSREIYMSEEIYSQSEGGDLMPSMSQAKKNQKDPPRSGSMLRDEIIREKGRSQNKMDDVLPSSSELDSAEKRMDKSASTSTQHIPQSANSSLKKARRILAYERPAIQKEKKESSTTSPESSSFKRSRSGRLLLPALEFWRNQRAIYDADRQIMGISDLNQPSGGLLL